MKKLLLLPLILLTGCGLHWCNDKTELEYTLQEEVYRSVFSHNLMVGKVFVPQYRWARHGVYYNAANQITKEVLDEMGELDPVLSIPTCTRLIEGA